MKKPIGRIGQLIMDASSKDAWYEAIRYPSSKEDIEEFIVFGAWQAIKQKGWTHFDSCDLPVRNPENHFDFTLRCGDNIEYLELMEVAPLDLIKSSYTQARNTYCHGDMADWIVQKIQAKSEKYGKGTSIIHLLVYSTDWRFELSPNIHWLLVLLLNRIQHRFNTILYYVPDEHSSGEIELIAPRKVTGATPENEIAARKRLTLIANLERSSLNPDGSVTVALGEKAKIEKITDQKTKSNKNTTIESQRKGMIRCAMLEIPEYPGYDVNVERIAESWITIYNNELKKYNYESFPVQYAGIKHLLGNVYILLAKRENKDKNCRIAIDMYKEALKVRTLERFPIQFAGTQNNLGITYGMLAEVEPSVKNVNESIKAFEDALIVYTHDRYPLKYAATQSNLGNAYRMLGEKENKIENCKNAINACKKALQIRTLEKEPMEYAMTQSNLGLAYKTLAEVDDIANNLRKAINSFSEALKVKNKNRSPNEYAKIQENIGLLYYMLADLENNTENLKKSIIANNEALKVYSIDRHPKQHSTIQNNLGIAYGRLAETEDKTNNLKKGIRACEEALKGITKENCPNNFHLTENNLKILKSMIEA